MRDPKLLVYIKNLLLLLANFVPVFGVWLLNWDVKQAWFLYNLETLVILGVTILKIVVVKRSPVKLVVAVIACIILFSFIYSIVGLGYYSTLWRLSGAEGSGSRSLKWGQFIPFISSLYQSKATYYALCGMILSYTTSTIDEYIVTGAYHRASLVRLMREPIMRVIIFQGLFVAGIITFLLTNSTFSMLIFILVKLAYEREEQKRRGKIRKEDEHTEAQRLSKKKKLEQKQKAVALHLKIERNRKRLL